MSLNWFQKHKYVIVLGTMLIFSNRSSSGYHTQGLLGTNLYPSASFGIGTSESVSGYHSSGSRGNYGGTTIFSNNKKNQNENSSVDQKEANSYATPNVEELFETLRTKNNSKRRFNSKSVNIPDRSTMDSTKR